MTTPLTSGVSFTSIFASPSQSPHQQKALKLKLWYWDLFSFTCVKWRLQIRDILARKWFCKIEFFSTNLVLWKQRTPNKKLNLVKFALFGVWLAADCIKTRPCYWMKSLIAHYHFLSGSFLSLSFLPRKEGVFGYCPRTYYAVIGSHKKVTDGVFSKLAVYAISIVFMGKSVNQCVK